MQYFIGLFFVAGSAFMTWKVTQLWRDADLVEHFMATFSFMPFGKEVKRGEIRSLALTVVSLWGVTVLLFLGLLDVDVSGPLTALFAVALGTVLLCLLCEVSVVLFNAPKFVVPPHMRSDLGVLAARRAHRAGGSRRTRT
ncbi:hypothetical protein [Streptomyces sp. DSM 15324]|uniref:hypothetical protein n=1 Tax=Streptomyces sp. DSM 15324 TaxID=1739111 RepID=UPI000747A429|nr:hypothetical protein [Streptomyces sp. DSM 15324]KUO12306.1 hypothetical protein AQJ58_08710 [Streptomyces sp. DSM 15324]